MSNASFTVHTLKNSTTPWFRNNLLSSGFLPHEVIGRNYSPLAVKIATWLEQHFEPEKLAAYNESQLENSFIGPLLLQLGWVTLPQQSLVVQGKQAYPDWCLLLEVDHDIILATEGAKQLKLIKAVTESKAWNKPLDNGKASKENLHHQLQDYLNTLHVRFGFLTNGRFWRIYDTENVTEQKTFIEFDLEQILALPDAAQKNQALALFAFFFCFFTSEFFLSFFGFYAFNMFVKKGNSLIIRHFSQFQNAVILFDEIIIFRNVFYVFGK